MIVLDVTDPSQIFLVGSMKVAASAPFDFVRDLGSSAVLVRFRDKMGTAVLDLRHPKQPRLAMTDELLATSEIRSLGDTAVQATAGAASSFDPQMHDYQVADTSDPSRPLRLATVTEVQDVAPDPASGATYLLGSAGLTVIRRPRVEGQQREKSQPTEPN